MKRALITGSFDPPTLGHIDVIRRTAAIFDEVTVCVCHNSSKNGTYTPALRMEMLRRSLTDLANVRVDQWDGLVADYAAANSVDVIVKGIRCAADYEYEEMIAQVNLLNAPIETMFISAAPEYRFISSTVAREMIRYNRALDKILPPAVIELLRQ